MVEQRFGAGGSGHSAAGPSRQAIFRRVVRGTVAWAAGVALLTVAFAWWFGARASDAVARQGERRLLDLVGAVAASISTDEALVALHGTPQARLEREIQSHLMALRRICPPVRSVFLLAPDTGRGVASVLVAARGDDVAHAASDVFDPPVGLYLREAMKAPVVSPASASVKSIVALAPVQDERGRTIALAGIEMDAGAIAGAVLARQGGTAAVAGFILLTIALFAAFRARRGLAELDRARAMQAQIAIYRVGDVLAGAETDEELMRSALDAVANGSGIVPWASYLREPSGGALRLFATRGLPPEASSELIPDAIARDAHSPASRAAWHGEVLVLSGPTAPPFRFGATTPGLGASPTVVSIPLLDGKETVAVLQCFLPREHKVETDELALIRWMATQVAVGLKRIRMERKVELLAFFAMGTGEILLGLDLTGAISYANAAAEDALRAGEGGLTGKPLESIAAFGQGDEPFGLVGAFEEGREFSGEVSFLRGDGTRFPAEVRISPTYDRSGALRALVLVGHDVIERREREAELEDRTRELALLNDQLQRAVGALEDARRAQSEFVANTSHELRTPLNAVIGFATLLEQGAYESDSEARDFAQRIRKSAEHLLGLLNDILDLSKLEAGRFQLSISLSDLRMPIQESMDAVASLAASRGLTLRADVPEKELPAQVDPARFRQVVTNLLGNALKYTDKGSVTVRAWRDGATGEAKIQIVDTGVGISREGQRRLFTKFGRVDLTYAGKRAGTGLGLAISKSLVQGMGGTITVESEGLGQGTRATVIFPAPVTEPALD